MGTGHVMRCLALAQAWQDLGGTAAFLSHELPPSLEERLQSEGIQSLALKSLEEDISETCEAAKKADWLVLDGYHFSQTHIERASKHTPGLLVIDDLGQFTSGGMTLLLNQNITASNLHYHQDDGFPILLLGSRMALLRREFRKEALERDFSEPCQRLLVTLGGSDPHQVTEKVISALLTLPFLQARIVVGAVNPRLKTLLALCKGNEDRLEVLSGVNDMVPHMDWAQLAVSAGGTSVLELASRAVPTLLVTVAENQEAICKQLDLAGIMIHAGWHHQLELSSLASKIRELSLTPTVRKRMANLGLSMCDGHGATRVARQMMIQCASKQLKLRLATEADARLVYEWANDPVTRAVSFNGDKILWDSHLPWFLARIQNPGCHIYIAEALTGEAVGMARFDQGKESNEAVISINMAPNSRQQGFGTALILAACDKITSLGTVKKITALIKQDNTASSRAFLRSGFRPTSSVEVAGQLALRMVWD